MSYLKNDVILVRVIKDVAGIGEIDDQIEARHQEQTAIAEVRQVL